MLLAICRQLARPCCMQTCLSHKSFTRHLWSFLSLLLQKEHNVLSTLKTGEALSIQAAQEKFFGVPAKCASHIEQVVRSSNEDQTTRIGSLDVRPAPRRFMKSILSEQALRSETSAILKNMATPAPATHVTHEPNTRRKNVLA